MKKSQKIIFIAGMSLGAMALVFRFIQNPTQQNLDSVPPLTEARPLSSVAPSLKKEVTRVPLSQSHAVFQVHANSIRKSWEKFAKQLNVNLSPEFSEDGHFLSAVGKGGGSGAEGFSPEDSERSALRAKEILKAAQDFLEIQSDWPLENRRVQTGRFSAQIYFSEMHDGLKVLPGAGVKIDLGLQGELLGIYSSYAPHLKVSNASVLESNQAKEKIVSSSSVTGGEKVIWRVGSEEGRLAYQFTTNGNLIVVDAETGKTLSSRNRRIY